ncbi:uncharacterized protein METZ01_LOCUS225955, partial [marine metagenome]
MTSCIGCMSSNQTYTTDLCLEDGYYTVWAKDQYGDGWNGGYYELTDAAGNIITTEDGPEHEGAGNSVWHQYPFGLGVPVAGVAGIQFDGVVLNDSETAAVVVTNTGAGELTVDSVAITTGAFSVSSAGLPAILDAGGSVSVQVTFTPTVEQDYDGYVTVYHSTDSSPDSVTVSGFGVDAYFYEGFDPYTNSSTDLPMAGWTILDNNEDADSIPQKWRTWYHDFYGIGYSGNMVAHFGDNNDYSADETMITPVIQTPGYAQLSFRTNDLGQYLVVDYSVDGTNFIELATVYVSSYYEQHDIVLPDVDSLWISFTFDPDEESVSTYMNIDEVIITEIQAQPSFDLFVSSTSLYPAELGDTVNTNFTIGTNAGYGDLVISSITSSDADFSVSIGDTVVFGGNIDLDLTWTPSSFGMNKADIIIAHNAASSPDTVSISAEAGNQYIDFDDQQMPLGWQNIDNDNEGEGWGFYSYNSPGYGGYYARSHYNEGGANDWMITEAV